MSQDFLQIDREFKRQKSKGTTVDNLDRNGSGRIQIKLFALTPKGRDSQICNVEVAF